jgi:S1-C subfamily serine protease
VRLFRAETGSRVKRILAIVCAGGTLAVVFGAAVLVGSFGSVRVTRLDAALAPEQVFARASPSVAMVYATVASGQIVGRGSGVFVQEGLLVTNCHVIARGEAFRVGHGQQHWIGRLAAYDVDTDLCLLVVPGARAEPAVVGDTRMLQVGQRVYAIGAPEGFELTFSEGVISGLRRAGERQYIQTTAPISDGSSGGGLFDSRGQLIGITSFVFSAGQNLNFAVPADRATELANKAAGPGDEASGRAVELPPGYARQWRHPVLK